MEDKKVKKSSLGRHEKQQELLYLSLLFFIISTLLIWMVFRNSGSFISPVSGLESTYLEQSKEFEQRQKEAMPLYDTLFSRIASMRNSPANPILEGEIKMGIETLNRMNENLPTKDSRFVAFHQMALFLQLYFQDMMVLKKKMENVQHFQDELSECEIGVKDSQTLMNQIKAAQAAKTNQ